MQHSKTSPFKISYLIFLFVISFSSLLFAGAPDTLWTRTYGGEGNESGFSVQQTSDGGFIITGNTIPSGSGESSIYIIRTNTNGDTLWTKTYGGGFGAYSKSIQQTIDSGFIVSGEFKQGDSSNACVACLMRINSSGDILWTKTYTRFDWSSFNSVCRTKDEGFIATGWAKSYANNNLLDVYLVRTNNIGDTLWTKTFGGDKHDQGRSVQQVTDGGYIITGFTESFGAGSDDVYLIRTDSAGDTLWTKTYGGTNYDYGRSVDQTSDEGFVIAGDTRSFGVGQFDFYLLRTDSAGDTLWTKTYVGTAFDQGYSVNQTNDNGFIIAGATDSSNMFSYVYLIRTNTMGEIEWTKTCGGSKEDMGLCCQQTTDGGFVVVGFTHSFGAGEGDVYLIRLDKETVGIQNDYPFNYLNPNDFIVSYNNNNLISIHYTIQYPSSVNLSMYNISGQLVKILFNEYKNAGDHTINFKTDNTSSRLSGVSAGVYYFKLTAGESSYTRKAVVVK